MDIEETLTQWFLGSKIFNGEAYLEYYSGKSKDQEYPEITAYAISLSCILYNRTKDERFLSRAETCAEYMKKIGRNGGVPCFSDNLLYTFDTGIFISSMLDLYAITEEETYLKAAEQSLDWLCSLWAERGFVAVDKIPENIDWYHLPSAHLAKMVIPLGKASRYLGDKKYERTAIELLGKYKQLQEENGCFKVNDSSQMVMTHPHCYAAEGFLYAYYHFKRPEFLEIAKKSSDWLCKTQNSDGSFYRCYNIHESSEYSRGPEKLKTTDATAQATRIWKLLGVNQEGIEKAYRYLNSELKDNGLRLFKNESFRGKLLSARRPIYSWPTFFYIHSLLLPFEQIEYCRELF